MGVCRSQPIKVVPVQGQQESPVKSTSPGGRGRSNSINASTAAEGDSTASDRSSSIQQTRRGGANSSARMRPGSIMSRKSARVGGGMYQGMGTGRVTGGRPISRNDDTLNHSGREERLRRYGGGGGGVSAGAGPLDNSQNSLTFQRQFSQPDPSHPFESSCADEMNTALLRINNNGEHTATKCPSCLSQFGKIVHLPYLLLCGHTYCSNCLDTALRSDPSFLKCGICTISTAVQPQTESKDLVLNQPVMELIENKQFFSILSNSKFDKCAECEKDMAIVYCSECSASFCEECNHQQHTGSRVRSKHKPVPINLKPRPQPTCKKHPGQSCVLYCETERQPMCVLCKFYGHHKFHNYQLLNNSSAAYKESLTKSLAQAEKVEASLSKAAHNVTNAKKKIKRRAFEAQEKLERSFEELKEEVIAALEQREATLLVLLDRQVQKREEIIQDEQEEVAFARARAIAAIEEAQRLLELNPVSALLARKHIDSVMDTVLKQTASFPDEGTDGDNQSIDENDTSTHLLPLGLGPNPDVVKRWSQTLEHHGAILQLPEKPEFVSIRILKDNNIHIKWKLSDHGSTVAADRTLSYSLQCFADVPFEFKKDKLFKRFQNQTIPVGLTPDSGFRDEESYRSSSQASESKTAGPSMPSLLPTLPSNNVSLVALQETTSKNSTRVSTEQDISKTEYKSSKVSTSIGGTMINVTPNTTARDSLQASAAILNLPPLLKKESNQHQTLSHQSNLNSTNSSNELPDDGSMNHGRKISSRRTKMTGSDATSSTESLPTTANTSTRAATTDNVTDMERYCKGYAFEEIYSGRETSFRYTGVIKGATYYFRIRCHNAAGKGQWSNTYKCSVLPL